jgi:hypothetical protein
MFTTIITYKKEWEGNKGVSPSCLPTGRLKKGD